MLWLNRHHVCMLHITSGDMAGAALAEAGLAGEIFVWHDICYDGPRVAGWPDAAAIEQRVAFIHGHTGGGLGADEIRQTMVAQYARLEAAIGDGQAIVLWFDACLFDMSMLAHILHCLALRGRREGVRVLVIDAEAGIDPYHGLGQLSGAQLAAHADDGAPADAACFAYAARVDQVFADQDHGAVAALAGEQPAALLPWMPAALERWLAEYPADGPGRLASLALAHLDEGACSAPALFTAVAAADSPPQYWGDTTLWGVVNDLADSGLVQVTGPADRLPQWAGGTPWSAFQVSRVQVG